jgi:IS1 family transposase
MAYPVVIPIDELWSFVGSKVRVPWVWVALDGATQRIPWKVVGDRSRATASRLWAAPPVSTRTDATGFPDHRSSDRMAVTTAQHRGVGTDLGLASYREQFWLTIRQSCLRLARTTFLVLPVPTEPRRCHLALQKA